ncbi:metalloproteinase inhibitor 2-like [Mytilus galloprovincialis]|uniref:metalloproteinase inhibitor 2-like n=1 Tax=Mytilus galloprovincialis TaxID=29158 RepID=UPI003F7BBDE4
MVKKVLQLIFVLVWMTNSVHCCSCPGIKHPQDQFCKADHVFYGKVINEELVPGPNNDVNNNDAIWKYTFKIIFKMKGVSEGVGKKIIIETAGNSARCGVRFTVGTSYILMGEKKPDGTKTIASCDFISQLNNLSPYQSFYLFANGSYSYRRNCNQGCK